jgi:two-component system LytT family sensor kinase
MEAKSSTKKNLNTLGVTLIISIIVTFIFSGSYSGISTILLNILYGIIIGTSIGLGCQLISTYFFRNERWIEKPSRTFSIVVLLVAAFILLDVVAVNSIWFYCTQGVSPIDLLQHPFGYSAMLTEFVIGMIIYLFIVSKNYARRLQENYERSADAEKEIEKYRYETLKNQINPHFLFNTLNTLSGLIYIDVERADEFIHRFSNIYRYVLDVQELDVISIKKELAFIDDYIHLNNIRFDNNIEMTISIEDYDQYIVPMSLQLLIENAVKHNVISTERPLRIRIKEVNNTLSVENDLHLKIDRVPSHKLGIDNLSMRYASLSDISVEIKQSSTSFSVVLPKLQND